MDPLETLLRTQPTLSLALGVLGIIVGSFLNVVIHRLPLMMQNQWERDCAELRDEPCPEHVSLSLAFPGSHCPSCGTTLAPWQNIPVLSYLVLRGRCRHCATNIPLRYPLIELLTAVVWVLCGLVFGVSTLLAASLLLSAVLIALTVIDLDHQLLPDSLTLPLLWLGLVINTQSTFVPLESAVWGAVIGYVSLWSVYWLFKLLTGKDGMGFGDFKLLAALGAWFGLSALPAMIFFSSLVGALVGIALIATGRQARDAPMPFGPFLAAAGLAQLFVPDAPLNTLLGVF